MGVIRGILLVTVCVLIFFLVLVGSILWTVSSSLQYEHVQPGLSSLVNKVVDQQLGALGEGLNIEEEIESLMPAIELYCQDNQQYTFNYEGNNIVIPCDVLTQGSGAVVSHGANSLIEQYYYKEYNCNFWDCFGESEIPLFLISQKAHDYWQGKFYLSLIAFFVLVALAFLLVEKKLNSFILVGGLTIIAALPLIKIGPLVSRLLGSAGEFGEYISEMVLVFFNQSHNIFIKIIIFGAVLLLLGIVLKIFHIGIVIANFFGKFSKSKKKISPKIEEVKKEHRSVYPKLWNDGAKKPKKVKEEKKEEKVNAPKGAPPKGGKVKKKKEKKSK